uniref:Thyroxine-binding globulin n=1 Tax=Sinocyclocheilus anshuiensis TaxID=1608454 RepID=A0A671RV46_9TELE
MNNDFAFHLCKRLVEMPEYQFKNIFLSPFSVSCSELSLGAGGETKKQLLSGIGRNSLCSIYQAVDDLESDSLMFLLTYIYFKGKWDLSFNPSKTHQSPCHVDAETTNDAPYASLKVYYDADLTSKFLFRLQRLFLHVSDVQMALSSISPDGPAINLSLKTSYSLNDILKALGIADMFTDKANFAGISEEIIFISKVNFKSSIHMWSFGSSISLYSLCMPFINNKIDFFGQRH